MRKRFRVPWVVLALTLASASSAHAATTAAGHLRVAIDSASSTADFSTTARSSFVILNEWEQAKMKSLKAANPNVKVLMYKNLSFMSAADAYGNSNAGVTTQMADPSWYLLNTSGQRFTSDWYSYMWAADIGNPAYQQKWADSVLSKLQTQGWDGVFADDTNASMHNHYDPASIAKYPTDAAYAAATGSALAAIGPKIRAAGKLIVPNFGEWRLNRSTVNGWLDYVSGGMEEMFTKWGNTTGTGYLPVTDWNLQLGCLKDAEAKGKYFLAVTHSTNTDAAAARYGWATILLASNGHASYIEGGDYTNQPWFPEYDYAIGEPAGNETADASGVHRRAYTNGLVVVNPTSKSVSVSLGGTYNGSGLTNATSATMAPNTALVLTNPAGTVTPPPPTTTTTTTPTTTTPTTTTHHKKKWPRGAFLGAVQVKTVSRSAGKVWATFICPKTRSSCAVHLKVRNDRHTRTAVVSRGTHRTVGLRLSPSSQQRPELTLELRAGSAMKRFLV